MCMTVQWLTREYRKYIVLGTIVTFLLTKIIAVASMARTSSALRVRTFKGDRQSQSTSTGESFVLRTSLLMTKESSTYGYVRSGTRRTP